jgi:hypothetical protein
LRWNCLAILVGC